MTPIPVFIPPEWNCTIVGRLYKSTDPADLSEDMLEITLPNGFLVAAGWRPDSDPNGSYLITVTNQLRHVIEPYWTKDASEASREVFDRVNRFYYRDFGSSQCDFTLADTSSESATLTHVPLSLVA